jgi:transcriptional regulator with GAF, ATPase, and Fis domain
MAENPFERDSTQTVESARPTGAIVRRFRLTVLDGPKPGTSWQSQSDRCSIGFHESNDLVIEDPTVSRFHCEIRIEGAAARVRDLESRNGTIVDGVGVFDALLRDGSLLKLGHVSVRFELSTEQNRLPLSDRQTFGRMVGRSIAMRTTFALMERAAATDFTVLLEGETGTGKGEAADALHACSGRADKRLVVVDCGAIPENLLESELFGHEKGSFTGATEKRVGAFEEAHGGTIFLDEIGELPLELQPKLLRVLQNREIRRVGSNSYKPVDVRVIAATNRDLRAEVNAGRFRPDLYFRMAVVKIPLPPLRQRPDDIPLLVDKILGEIRVNAIDAAPLKTPEFLASLSRAAWPGNVRELRNHLEQCLVYREPLPSPAVESVGETVEASAAPLGAGLTIDARQSYAEARQSALAQFERLYVQALLEVHEGKVSEAAEVAQVTRVHLYRLMRRHGIKP